MEALLAPAPAAARRTVWAARTVQDSPRAVAVCAVGALVVRATPAELQLLRPAADGSLTLLAAARVYDQMVALRPARGDTVLVLTAARVLTLLGVAAAPAAPGFVPLGRFALGQAAAAHAAAPRSFTMLDVDPGMAYAVCAALQGWLVFCALQPPAADGAFVSASQSLRVTNSHIMVGKPFVRSLFILC